MNDTTTQSSLEILEQRLPNESQEQWATRLLSQGASERKTSEIVGISRRQVGNIKKALKTTGELAPWTEPTPKAVLTKDIEREIHRLACRPEGVKRSELSKQFAALYGFKEDEDTGKQTLNMSRNQYYHLRNKILKMPSESLYEPLFVPEWMPRQRPKEANQRLLEAADILVSRINEITSEFCHEFPETHPQYFCKVLLSLAIEGVSPEPLTKICHRNNNISHRLSLRQSERSLGVDKQAIRPSPSDSEFDALCY